MRVSKWVYAFVAVTLLFPIELSVFAKELSPALSWEQIFNVLRRKKPPYGSRGDGLCALSPADVENTTQMLNVRPTFLWRGTAYAIALRTPGAKQNLWEQVLTNSPESIVLQQEKLSRWQHSGQPLQPGKTYEFLLYHRMNDEAPRRTLFRILPAKEQTEIRAMLANIGGENSEAISLQRIQALMERSLWSDAVVEAYATKRPSVELTQVMQQIPDQICEKAGD